MNLQAIYLLKYIGISLFILGVLILAALIQKAVQSNLILDKKKINNNHIHRKTRQILIFFAIIYIIIGFAYIWFSLFHN